MAAPPLPIDAISDLLLLVLWRNEQGGRTKLSGVTRLQKLVFLISQRPEFQSLVKRGLVPDVRFEAYRMGPFTSEIYEGLELLTEFDPPLALETTPRDRRSDLELDRYLDEVDLDRSHPPVSAYPRPTEYALTNDGRFIASRLWDAAPEPLRKAIDSVREEYGGLPLRELLRRVYKTYPKYTERSEIREQLGLTE